MTKCTTDPIPFTTSTRRLVEANFFGGHFSNGGGSLLLREMDRHLQLTSSLVHTLEDNREQKKGNHDYLSLLRQRFYGIWLGYEDLNDHESLRNDPLIQPVFGKDTVLAIPSTLADLKTAWAK